MPTLVITTTTNYTGTVFSNIDTVQFSTSGSATATFTGSQFVAGQLSPTGTLIGDGFTNTITVNAIAGPFDGSQVQFSNWTDGVDIINLNGDSSGNQIAGTSRNDVIDGGGGNDTLFGGLGLDTLIGSGGIDTLYGQEGDDNLRGGIGNDFIDGGTGNDEVRYDRDAASNGLSGVTVNLLTSTATDGFGNTDTLISIEAIRGTNFADTLTGGVSASFGFEGYRGLGGNDIINGGGGYDEIRYDLDLANGGSGGITANLQTGIVIDGFNNTDTVSGIEAVRGTAQADVFIGSDRVEYYGDTFFGLAGVDTYTGGRGYDEVRYDRDAAFGGALGVIVNLQTGTATDGWGNAETMSGMDNVRGTNQVDQLTGDAGDNTLRGLAGNDILNGGDGFDVIGYDADFANGGLSGVTVNLATGLAIDGFGNTDTISGIEAVRGTDFADSLTGDSGRNTFNGYAGNDTINGGDGFDEARYDNDWARGGTNAVQVNLATGVAIDGFGNTDTLISIENVRGTRLNDTFIGGAANENFTGLAGNDSIDGGGGTDTAYYLSEIFADVGLPTMGVTVNLATGTATDGFGGTDTLVSIENASGGMLADTFTGSSGDNVFVGFAGNDSFNGGGGNDTVDYNAESTIGIANAYFVTFSAGVTVNLGTETATDAYGNTDTLVSIENINGTSFADVVIGNADGNGLIGNGGNDTLLGGGGSDIITGGSGNDGIDGGTGSDAALWSGARANYFVRTFVSSGQFFTQVSASTGTDGIDTLLNVETLGFGNRAYGLAGIQQNLVSNMDGERFDDVLFQNSATGQVAYINMGASGAGGFTSAIGGLPAGWRLVSSDDVSGDGRADLIVQDTTTGAIYTANIASGSVAWGVVATGIPASFQAIATGDVTRDGTADVLVRDNTTGQTYIADLDAGGAFGGWVAGPNLGTAWRTVGLGDFNGDGASDILFQNTADGTTYYRDVANQAWGLVSGAVGAEWVAREAADLNGDSYADVIFRNTNTGDIIFANMLGGGNAGWGVVAGGLAAWEVRGSADVDNDGWRDVIIQNTADGTTLYANMDNGTFVGWGAVSGAFGTQWTAIA